MNFIKMHCLNETGDVNLVQNAKFAKFEKFENPIIDEKRRSSARQVHKL